MIMYLKNLGENALKAKFEAALLSEDVKNNVLKAAASALTDNIEYIISENSKDLENGKNTNMSSGMLDRLMLNESRIKAMSEGILEVAMLPDPVNKILESFVRPNGMNIIKKSVPIGVIGIIYEARPNVTADAFALTFKSGNAVILKGGSNAINSNIAITKVIREAIASQNVNPDVLQLIEKTDRETTNQFIKMNDYIDCLIPRGSEGLIKTLTENSTIPVINGGSGNCHIYIDKDANVDMAVNIVFNAKTQRIGVCNACESLVVHKDIREVFLPAMAKKLSEKNVEIRGDKDTAAFIDCVPATEEDFGTEYLDYILSVKTVDNVEEAIDHINKYNTGHSDCIVTGNEETAKLFLDSVDAACVYHNVSTRFTDGFEFGFGAEIGISTQKLHARGPMGLKELTSYKYVITGNGQIRG